MIVGSNKDELSSQILNDVCVLVLPTPRAPFTEDEFNHVRDYVHRGGALLVTLGEGGEKQFHTNVNFLLEEFGMMVNNGE